MVFHEITQSAITDAVAHPRDLDEGLVDAAETRRILDRLYGCEVSPVLWRRVNRGLAAGRVQSPATRLVVERERERMAFVAAALLGHRGARWPPIRRSPPRSSASTAPRWPPARTSATTAARSTRRRARRGARRRARRRPDGSGPRRSAPSRRSPTVSSPKPPFMTSHAAAGGRAQAAPVGPAGDAHGAGSLRARATSPTCAPTRDALGGGARRRARHGGRAPTATASCRSGPRQFTTKVKNAQEAHEAIRPTTPLRSPDQVSLGAPRSGAEPLPPDLAAHAGLPDGRCRRHHGERAARRRPRPTTGDRTASSRPAAPPSRSRATARRTSSPPTTTADADAEREALLPALTVGQHRAGGVAHAERPHHHAARPLHRGQPREAARGARHRPAVAPGRASSRPSSTAATCGRRARRWCRPGPRSRWSRLLEQHFDELVDYAFTARLEDDLDAIASATRTEAALAARTSTSATSDHCPGLKRLVEENLDKIDAAEINTFPIGYDADGNEIVVKPGKYGPYVKRGDDTASVPETMAPDELTVDEALRLLAAPKSDEPDRRCSMGCRSSPRTVATGRTCSGASPTRCRLVSTSRRWRRLFKTMTLERITLDEAKELLSLPRVGRRRPGRRPGGRRQPTVATGRTCRRARSPAHHDRGAAARDHARRRRWPILAQPRRSAGGGGRRTEASAAGVRHRPRQRSGGRGQGRPVRRLRHRRRDQRVASAGATASRR